ncbi:hypothetical protein Z550_00001, partial [Mycobacterium tuberculosis 3280CJ]
RFEGDPQSLGFEFGDEATVISEIGADPAAWFPSAEHLVCW